LADALEDALTHYEPWQTQVSSARAWLTQRYSLNHAIRSIETLLSAAAAESFTNPLNRTSGLFRNLRYFRHIRYEVIAAPRI
jgi:hypothetical protein